MVALWLVIVVLTVGGVCAAPNPNKLSMTTSSIKNLRQSRSVGNSCNCECGVSNSRGSRVVGGEEARPHEFPWLAGLAVDGVSVQCGASLVTRRHLLTAAHCVWGADAGAMRVLLGDHQRDAGAVQRRVRRVHVHAAFDHRTYNNDIALLELDQPVEFSENVKTVCLPTTDKVNYTSQVAVVAGWGRVEERGELSDVVRRLRVPVWSHERCLESDYQTNRLTPNMLCAGYPEGGRDACQGDSGGPLHLATPNAMEVIGLVSWGRGCARPNLPGLYTKVANYLDWIDEALEGECTCSRR